ncbi:MAG: hypothetical protein OER96_12000 [Gammaproteobacteria bacterium]|nr:hypothetical protein [Gammaproteobacteria bacterium]
MTNAAVPFPESLPKGYVWFEDEPEFDPARHLALEKPKHIRHLSGFGYTDDEVKTKATTVAVSSPFRILSDEGANALLQVARSLRQHSISCERIDNMVRSGCYRSRFLRDLCIDPSLTELMCEIYDVDVAPHTMPVHLGHINYSPDDLSRAVDKWHHDTLPLDFVMMVTDPATLVGGKFEYFVGTKHEMAALAKEGKTPPRDRVESPPFDGSGYAIALHGDMIVHRGAPLEKPGERITMVNGYVSTNTSGDDQHRHKDLTVVDDPEALYAEWAKHVAWRAQGRLNSLINDLSFSSDRKAVAAKLEEAIKDVSDAIEEMRDDSEHNMHHYEKS